MNRRFATLASMTALILACVCLATVAFAQDNAASKPRAMYLAIPPHSYYPVEPSTTQLTQWTYSFTYNGQKYTPVIVGTNATNTNASTLLWLCSYAYTCSLLCRDCYSSTLPILWSN